MRSGVHLLASGILLAAPLLACSGEIGGSPEGMLSVEDVPDAAPDPEDTDDPLDLDDAMSDSDVADIEGDVVDELDADADGTDTPIEDSPSVDTAPDDVADEPPADTSVPDVPPDIPTQPDTSQDLPPADTGDPNCPGAPPEAPANAAAALAYVNEVRQAMGVPCARMQQTINEAARLHCEYYAANSGACTQNAHQEVEGCEGFVAVNFYTRMRAAGYMGQAAFENMHFVNNPSGAVQGWIDSVWHRTPVLSPWVGDLGYGAAPGCDTMDFGVGTPASSDMVALYPYEGQTGVPRQFSGNEGPRPPAPDNGWPSGYPIHIYARSASIDTHTLTVDGDTAELDHVWITPAQSNNLLQNEHVMYANDALQAGTTYRVTIVGTYAGGPLDLSWTFTTR